MGIPMPKEMLQSEHVKQALELESPYQANPVMADDLKFAADHTVSLGASAPAWRRKQLEGLRDISERLQPYTDRFHASTSNRLHAVTGKLYVALIACSQPRFLRGPLKMEVRSFLSCFWVATLSGPLVSFFSATWLLNPVVR